MYDIFGFEIGSDFSLAVESQPAVERQSAAESGGKCAAKSIPGDADGCGASVSENDQPRPPPGEVGVEVEVDPCVQAWLDQAPVRGEGVEPVLPGRGSGVLNPELLKRTADRLIAAMPEEKRNFLFQNLLEQTEPGIRIPDLEISTVCSGSGCGIDAGVALWMLHRLSARRSSRNWSNHSHASLNNIAGDTL